MAHTSRANRSVRRAALSVLIKFGSLAGAIAFVVAALPWMLGDDTPLREQLVVLFGLIGWIGALKYAEEFR